MNFKPLFFVLFMSTVLHSFSQFTPLINIQNREQLSLDGAWHYIVDPYENGYYDYRYRAFDQSLNPSKNAFFLNSKQQDKTDLLEYNFDKSPTMTLPTDWNTADDKLFYYEGTVWFKKSFAMDDLSKEKRHFLYFGGVNYKAEVYLNSKKLGTHEGGFTPFYYEVSDVIREDNFVVVKVDNKRKKEAIPTLNTDWWNYGGITRSVQVISTPKTYIDDYILSLNEAGSIDLNLSLTGPDKGTKEVEVSIPELDIKQSFRTDSNGKVTTQLRPSNLIKWSPENPKRYQVSFNTTDDSLEELIGFRTITTKGEDILLNGEPVFLKGISIHEERPNGGRVRNAEEARILLEWAKELGCNYVRLAHYPHNEDMARIADELGILVWEEIPVYWTIDWTNAKTYANAESQLTEMINRDKNRAAVVIWSMANETPVNEDRSQFLTKLASKARSLDNTRLISAALEQSAIDEAGNIRTISDPFAEVVDVLSFNQYIGWYDGLPEKARNINWQIDLNKPVMISEFGAGAKFGFHADDETRFSEEYQAKLYKETLDMLKRIPQLRGLSPWILMDFRSPRRVLPEIQENWNRKGLLSEKGEKKQAYFVLQDFYKNN